MNANKAMDPLQLCRICAVDVADDTTAHLLVENKTKITVLGEKFIACLGIELLKDGFPDRVCDYCQSQLNTFDAFVRKARNTSTQFESILQTKKRRIGTRKRPAKMLLSPSDMLFEEEEPEKVNVSLTEMEIFVEKEADLYRDETIIPDNDDDDEYTVEYLDPEYMNTYDNEDAQNEDEEDDEELDGEGKSTDKDTKKSTKRTYPYKCSKCAKRFVYKEVYEAHIRIHKGLPGFSCPHCPKTFNEKSNFDYHMQDHTNYRPAKCNMCEKSFKNKQDLASHIRCHKDIRKYMCDVCGKRFRSQSHMTYHRYAHFEERNFPCDQCEQKFKSPHILRTHRNTVHSNVFRYECEQCGRKFKRDHHLVAHRRTHNKTPGSRKARKKIPDQKTDEETTTFEMVEMIKAEDIEYETYETELIDE